MSYTIVPYTTEASVRARHDRLQSGDPPAAQIAIAIDWASSLIDCVLIRVYCMPLAAGHPKLEFIAADLAAFWAVSYCFAQDAAYEDPAWARMLAKRGHDPLTALADRKAYLPCVPPRALRIFSGPELAQQESVFECYRRCKPPKFIPCWFVFENVTVCCGP